MNKNHLQSALNHFLEVDSTMHKLLRSSLAADDPLVAPKPKDPELYFQTLASSINSQQISIKAAEAIWGRLIDLLGQATPENILSKNDEELASVGLSRQKIRYMRSLAEYADSQPSFLTLHERDNEVVITELTEIVGIGRWTAEMFLMFALARPDVFSYGDLGLMRALEANYGIHYKDKSVAKEIIEPLAPHRTTAALTLWMHKDNEPILL